MSVTPKYYIVDARALPEVFLKVAEAKRMLETGEAFTVGEATRRAEGHGHALQQYALRAYSDLLHSAEG